LTNDFAAVFAFESLVPVPIAVLILPDLSITSATSMGFLVKPKPSPLSSTFTSTGSDTFTQDTWGETRVVTVR
jgi:hypothetical protein